VSLPPDGHVHSEWSWDAPDGAMERTCARAVELGLPAVAFTEHSDALPWDTDPGELDGYDHLAKHLRPDGAVAPPPFDVEGYLAAIARCRHLFPQLRIVSGVEIGEPHWRRDEAARLVAAGLDRVLGSLHCLRVGDRYAEPGHLVRHRPAADVLRDYLAEVVRLIEGSDAFAVLAHLDYAVRTWPGPFDPYAFEDEFRHALRTLADSGRTLEVNTRGPLLPELVRWWRDEGGETVAFGSDAHRPDALAYRFAEATAMVEAHGFRPGRHPYDHWRR
jgi:histidinol-phosphatase (PHP family)